MSKWLAALSVGIHQGGGSCAWNWARGKPRMMVTAPPTTVDQPDQLDRRLG